jgi:hypothetical protein
MTLAPDSARVVRRPLRLPSTTEHVLLLRDGWERDRAGVYRRGDERVWWMRAVGR